MSANVISHRKPRRKRGSAWGWTARRIGALIVAAIAIMAASWLAPELNRPAPSATTASRQPAQPMLPPAPPALGAVDVSADLAGPPPRAPRITRRAGVPLNAGAAIEPDDYEILSAAELANISQARD